MDGAIGGDDKGMMKEIPTHVMLQCFMIPQYASVWHLGSFFCTTLEAWAESLA